MKNGACTKCQGAEARATECLGLLNEAQARNLALVAALAELFEQCVMMHKYGGEGCNRKEADAAVETARALL